MFETHRVSSRLGNLLQARCPGKGVINMFDFKKSLEASWRRCLRSAVNQSQMTRGQKAVTIAVLNLWMHHRNDKGYIYPGRRRLAKATGLTEKTVSRTLAMLRAADVLRVRARLRGEGQKPTEYTMATIPLLHFCGAKLPKWIEGELVQIYAKHPPMAVASAVSKKQECPTTGGKKCPTVLTEASIVKFTSDVQGRRAENDDDE